MQTIIELTRNIRDRHTLSLKVGAEGCFFFLLEGNFLIYVYQTPLRELIVFHPDAQYLDDVRPLLRYLQSELNVRDVVLTSDESRAGVRYRAVADWSVLGRKLRRDLARVKNALPNVPSEDVKRYADTGKLVVDGIELIAGDLTVQRYVELTDGQGQYGSHSDNDVVVLLDVQVHPELMGEWLARELINRVQKLRKKAGLQATDDVDVFYQIPEGTGADLLDAMSEHAETIRKTIRGVPVDVKERKPEQKVLIEEEQEVADTTFTLSLATQ